MKHLISEFHRVQALEDENLRLKQLLGEKELNIQALKTVVEGKY